MDPKYPRMIWTVMIVIAVQLAGILANSSAVETIETIIYKDPDGLEHREHAFREPMRGLPEHGIKMFCANVKMRLYWGVFREEIKASHRKGLYLRRMARLGKHIFEDIRDADKPFNATMLSKVDKYFGVSLNADEKSMDESFGSKTTSKIGWAESSTKKKLKCLKERLSGGPLTACSAGKDRDIDADDNGVEEIKGIESNEAMQKLEAESSDASKKKLKKFLRMWLPRVALGIYTRVQTMWWMMMSCLFTKYYLWDTALDEFNKLKRNLIMWPEFQLITLKELPCKPVQLFKRLLDVCKLLNPLMRIDFGQLDLDKLTRFKSSASQ